jgi:hypothetical protein
MIYKCLGTVRGNVGMFGKSFLDNIFEDKVTK